MNKKRTGVVVRFGARGFGFIQDSKTQENIYVHVEDIEGRMLLRTGDVVEFEVFEHPRGPRANQVNLVKSLDRVVRS